MAIDLSDLGPGQKPVDLSDLGTEQQKPIDLSDLGEANPTLSQDIATGVKDTVKDLASKALMPLRGYEALGVGAADLIAGKGLEESVLRAGQATQPGFDPQGVAENVGSFAGGSLPFLAVPGTAPATMSRAAKLIHAAKTGAVFAGSLSTLSTLEEKGSVSFDDAEKIAINSGIGALISTAGEAILGPILRRIFPGKATKVPSTEPAVEVPTTTPPSTPEYTPSAAARRARASMTGDELEALQVKNQQELDDLLKTRELLEQHKTALSDDAKKMLDEINQEVSRLIKSDKLATTKQMLKEMGQDVAEMTPAKAEDTLTRVSKHDFVVAAKTDKGVVTGEPGMIHGMLEWSKGGAKLEDMGYVDRLTGKYYSRAEAAKAINPDYKAGDAIHSSQMNKLQKNLEDMTPEELRVEQMRMSEERNKIWHDKYEKLPGTTQEKLAKAKADPAYKELDAIDLELHKLMKEKANVVPPGEPKLKDLTPTLNTNKGMIQGIPGQELDDLIAQHDLDVVADNVIEGYTDKTGKFLSKEEVLGPTSTSGTDLPGDKFTFKGKKAWSGVVDLTDGKIEEVHPYSKAEAADFHHAQYLSDQAMDKIDIEEASPFFIDKDGNIWNGSDDSLPQYIIDRIKQQIKIISSNVPERSRLMNQWATETAQTAKDLGYKTSDEAIKWAEKSHHHLNNDYKLALRNQFVRLTKAEPPAPIPPSKPVVSATPYEPGESAPILKASEMGGGKVPPKEPPVAVSPGAEEPIKPENLLVAFKYKGKLYTGKNVTHISLIDEYGKDNKLSAKQIDKLIDEIEKEGGSSLGYVTKEGKFLTKDEAGKLVYGIDYNLSATELPTYKPDAETFIKHEPVPGVEVYSKPVEKQTQELTNPWAEKMADNAKKAGAKTPKEAIEWASKNEKDLLLFDKQNIALEFDRKYGTGKPIVAEEVIPELKDLQTKLTPEAGTNPDVADVIDASRKKGVNREPHVTMETQYNATGQGWKFKLKGVEEVIPKELPNENQIKIKNDTANSKAAAKTGVPEGLIQSSPSLPGTDMAPAFIPEYIAGTSNWRVGWFARLARSTSSVLEKMGDSGKELAARIKLVDDSSFIKSNSFLYTFDKYLTQIPKADWQKAGISLADQLEGKPGNYKLPPGMLEHVQKMFGDFADEATKLDFKILRADGTKVEWAARQNFYPRVVKQEFLDGLMRNDKVTVGRMKQYLIDSKQVSSDYQASQKVQAIRKRFMERRYGHLERAREFDLPPEFYDRQAITVIPEYVRAAAHRIEEVRQFGMHDSKIIKLLDNISAEGHDSEMARQVFDRYVGAELSDIVHTRLVQGVKNLVTGMSIQFPSAVTQIGQVLTPIHRATTPELGFGLAKAYARAATAFIKAFTTLGKEEASHAGMAFESAAVDYLLDTYGGVKSKPFQKFAEKSLQLSGFTGEDTFFRRFAALLGKKHIEDEIIPRILRNGSDKYAVTELRALGLNPTIIRAQGGLSEAELNIAVKRFSDQVQGNPNVLNLPLWWSSPNGRLATQFHTFSVVIGKENWLLAKNAVKTGNINRLVSMGLGTPLVGAGISFIKEDMLGLKPTDFTGDKDTDNLIRWYMNGTSFGVAIDLALQLSKGRSAFTQAFQIPAVQTLAGFISDVKDTAKGDKKALKRIAQKTPVVGRVLFQ